MMKVLIVLICLLGFAARADDVSGWANTYLQVKSSYVYNITYEKMAIAALKGLKDLDANLTVGNDNRRISLYYKGKVVMVENKPENDTALEWGAMTDKIIAMAEKVSPKAEQRNFEINSIMAQEMVKILDEDSKFYEDADEASGLKVRNHRQFAARMDGDALYIKIAAFNKQTKNEILKALNEYENAKGLILDLRASPGGMLGEAIKIADLFLDEGIIASIKGKKTDEEVYYVAEEDDWFAHKPIVILVDGNSASAAEVLTAALQEQKRATVIGTGTKGKGTVQKLIKLYPEGGVLAITNGFFMTPSGKKLNKKGIVPDICTFGEVQYINNGNKCPPDERENSETELAEAKKALNLSE